MIAEVDDDVNEPADSPTERADLLAKTPTGLPLLSVITPAPVGPTPPIVPSKLLPSRPETSQNFVIASVVPILASPPTAAANDAAPVIENENPLPVASPKFRYQPLG